MQIQFGRIDSKEGGKREGEKREERQFPVRADGREGESEEEELPFCKLSKPLFKPIHIAKEVF